MTIGGARWLRRPPLSSLLLVALCISAEASAQTAPTEPTQVTGEAANAAAAQARGNAAFRAGNFEAASTQFRHALDLTPARAHEHRQALLFNLGSCAFELNDFERAEVWFDDAAEEPGPLSSEARLHAGFAALRRGDLAAAARHLAEAGDSQDEAELRRSLKEGIEAERAHEQEEHLVRSWRQADAAFQLGEFEKAQRGYQGVLLQPQLLSREEQAYLHRQLSATSRQLGQLDDERTHLSAAYELAGDPRDLVTRGDSHLSSGHLQQASDDYGQALAGDLTEDEKEIVRERQQQLWAVSPAGLHGWLSAGFGYDTNAAQSGAADALGVSQTTGDPGSPYALASAGLGYSLRPEVDWAITPRYRAQLFALTDSEVEGQSLQEHLASLDLEHSSCPECLTRFEAGAFVQLVSLSEVSPFTFGGYLRGSWQRDFGREPSGNLRLAADATYRPLLGLGDYDYMGGHRLDVRFSAARRFNNWTTSGWASFRYYGIGSLDFTVGADELFACGGDSVETNPGCQRLSQDSADYYLPLGYWAPRLGVREDWAPRSDWLFSAAASLEYRQYLEESFAQSSTGDPGLERLLIDSAKLRRDLRPQFKLGARYDLDSRGQLSIGLDYTWLLSISNMQRDDDAPTPADVPPRSNFDYDDRNFSQHLLETHVDFVF